MRFSARHTLLPAALFFALALAAACGGGNGGSETGLSGSIDIDGSSTVFPITQAVAEEFRKTQNKVQVPVGVSGTGGGFKRFVTGETVINDASRPIKPSEVEAAKANGIEFIELEVALDGVAIVTNSQATFVDCLTVAELRTIWAPGSKVNNWNQVRSSFPDAPLRLYGPGTDSGTFDYFTEVINGTEDASRADYTASEDDNVLVQGISGDRSSLGYFGYAFYAENSARIRLLGVDAGKGCVKPTRETINTGTYAPLSRHLYIYVNKKSLERPEVKAFVEFYLKEASILAEEVGYVALPASDYQAGLSKIR
ncbi:MAG: PstS family phosphate ABC transporter substrate-binding protein [SAR202 cluster bacterium]|nr:PstS family phosphate ABC transporter substrate-binding protein [SAR202 cluster bacterium]